jgi:hypothetical protein
MIVDFSRVQKQISSLRQILDLLVVISFMVASHQEVRGEHIEEHLPVITLEHMRMLLLVLVLESLLKNGFEVSVVSFPVVHDLTHS